MKKTKLISFLTSIFMILSLNPLPIHASTEFDIWINGEQFTSDNMTIECGEGKATLKVVEATIPYIITLEDATIDGSEDLNEGIQIGTESNNNMLVSIVMKGTNIVKGNVSEDSDENRAAILAYGRPLFTGDGQLYAYGAYKDTDKGAIVSLQESGVVDISDLFEVTICETKDATDTDFEKDGLSLDLSETSFENETLTANSIRLRSEYEKYPIWINGQQLSEYKKSISVGEGKVSLTVIPSTVPYNLTLEDVILNEDYGEESAIVIGDGTAGSLVTQFILQGENKVYGNPAILLKSGTLVVSGDGTLYAYGNGAIALGENAVSISSDTYTMKGLNSLSTTDEEIDEGTIFESPCTEFKIGSSNANTVRFKKEVPPTLYSLTTSTTKAKITYADGTKINTTDQLEEGQNVSFKISANKGYVISSILVNGKESINQLKSGKLTLSNISQNTKITVKTKAEEYKVIQGQNSTFQKGKDLVFKFDGPCSLFKKLIINDLEISTTHYTVKSGSTVITLSQDYVSRFQAGRYTVTAVYSNGSKASADFTVEQVPKEETKQDNKTVKVPTSQENSSTSTKQNTVINETKKQETTQKSATNESTNQTVQTTTDSTKKATNSKTGVETSTTLYKVVAVISIIGIIALVLIKRMNQ